MKKFFSFLLTGVFLFLLNATSVNAQGAPKIQLVTPSVGQILYGNRIPVLFAIENFILKDASPKTSPQPNQGHILMWLDDQNPTADSATKITQEFFTYSDIAYGEHQLKAELTTSDNKSLNPPQAINITFKNVALSSPIPAATSGFDKKTTLIILIIVALVIVAAWWYTKEEDGETPAKSQTKKETKTAIKKKSRKTKK
jgi:hypothetical protein